MVLTIGQQITRLRKKSGNAQSALAKYMSVSTNTVRKWERDKRTPSPDQLGSLSAFFGENIFTHGLPIETAMPPDPAPEAPALPPAVSSDANVKEGIVESLTALSVRRSKFKSGMQVALALGPSLASAIDVLDQARAANLTIEDLLRALKACQEAERSFFNL